MNESFGVTRILLAALAALALAVSSSCTRPSGPPRAVAERAQIDLGSLAPGEQAVAEFTVRNDGGEPLEVEVGEPQPRLPRAHAE
ncbi:MAG: hypothetical protein AB1689_03590, partial [Thermodesulfobacteriota bacterium]